MVAKRGWHLLTKPHSLVARIYKEMYFAGTNFLKKKLGKNHCLVWRSIWKARKVLTLGCRWSIGDGRNILVMYAPWLRGKVEGRLKGPQRQVAKDILQVPLVEEVVEDKWNWKKEQNGCYSVRSGYRVWRKEQGRSGFISVNGEWCSLWNIKAPPRVKHLLWRLCRDCLPTRVRLRQHHVSCPSGCPFYEHPLEDLWHVFFGCDATIQCWRAASL